MTVASETTLLELINEVLLDVGERQVTSINQPFAKKAEQYIRESLREIQHLHDWEWLYSTTTPISWSGDVATLLNIQRIYDVSWDNTSSGGTYWRIHYLKPEIYNSTAVISSFDSSIKPSTRPLIWTFSEYNTIRVNPYPTDSSGKSKVKVYVILDMVPPISPTSVFPLPEFMIPVLRKRATYLMYVRHLGDIQGANIINEEFNQMIHYIRTRQAKHPVGGQLNMFKANRRYP